MLVKRFRGEWPGPDAKSSGYFSLGRWGLPVNIVAVLWGGLMALNLAWPREDVYGEGLLAWTAFIFIGAPYVSARDALDFREAGSTRCRLADFGRATTDESACTGGDPPVQER